MFLSFFKKILAYFKFDNAAPEIDSTQIRNLKNSLLKRLLFTLVLAIVSIILSLNFNKKIIYYENPSISKVNTFINADEKVMLNKLSRSFFIQFLNFDPILLSTVKIKSHEFFPPYLQLAKFENDNLIEFLSPIVPMELCDKDFLLNDYLSDAQYTNLNIKNNPELLESLVKSSYCIPNNFNGYIDYFNDIRLLINLSNENRKIASNLPSLLMQISSKKVITNLNSQNLPIGSWINERINFDINKATYYQALFTTNQISINESFMTSDNSFYEINTKESIYHYATINPDMITNERFSDLPTIQLQIKQSFNKNKIRIKYFLHDYIIVSIIVISIITLAFYLNLFFLIKPKMLNLDVKVSKLSFFKNDELELPAQIMNKGINTKYSNSYDKDNKKNENYDNLINSSLNDEFLNSNNHCNIEFSQNMNKTESISNLKCNSKFSNLNNNENEFDITSDKNNHNDIGFELEDLLSKNLCKRLDQYEKTKLDHDNNKINKSATDNNFSKIILKRIDSNGNPYFNPSDIQNKNTAKEKVN